jgi:hypothetical protein
MSIHIKLKYSTVTFALLTAIETYIYILDICASLNIEYQVLHPYITNGKIIVFHIQMCVF